MQHSGQVDVVNENRFPRQEAGIFKPSNSLANVSCFHIACSVNGVVPMSQDKLPVRRK
jgi:hypothetical protein